MLAFKDSDHQFDWQSIRTQVFINEQGFKNEFDRYDAQATHLVVYDNGERIGCLRFFKKHDEMIVGRLAILPLFRSKGYGSLLLKEATKRIKALGYNCISLDAQLDKIPFYEHDGYQAFGEPHYDEHVLHQRMKKLI